jgi:hypothetical protein
MTGIGHIASIAAMQSFIAAWTQISLTGLNQLFGHLASPVFASDARRGSDP